jgi:hypothetical protein
VLIKELLSEVQVNRCRACGSELILTNVVPDDTVSLRGIEHHTFVCSECHVTEVRVVFIKDGRETDNLPVAAQGAQRAERGSTVQDEPVAAPSLLGRVMARLRGN